MLETCRGKGKDKAAPLVAWSDPESSRNLMLQDFVKTAQDCVNVDSRTYRPPLYPKKYSWYSFLLEAESNSEGGFYINENQMISAGSEPATFRFVAQHLKYCATGCLRSLLG